jgi:hypothetical protein
MEYVLGKEEFQTALQSWKSKENHSAEEIVLYNIIRCKNPDRGFSEKKSNIQGNEKWYAFNLIVRKLKWDVYLKKTESFEKLFGIVPNENVFKVIESLKEKF